MNLLEHYLDEMNTSISRSEAAEGLYSAVVASHQDRYGKGVTADFKAAGHPTLRQAVGDGSYYRDRAQMYGIAAVALLINGGAS